MASLQYLRGLAYDITGAALASKTVNLYTVDDLASIVATTTTDANGLWNFDTVSSTANTAVKIINGTNNIWLNGKARIQLTSLQIFTTFHTYDDTFRLTASSGSVVSKGTYTFNTSADSAAVADTVTLGCYEISAGNRALALGQEAAVSAEADETKFSNKLPVRINGTTYYVMLTVS